MDGIGRGIRDAIIGMVIAALIGGAVIGAFTFAGVMWVYHHLQLVYR